jgi:5,10-methylenetetrahydromethanopterin reductase
MPDSQLIWRDVFAALTASALATSTIRLGTAVSNLSTRHRTVLASAARTLQEASDGRFILGLGRGDSSVSLVGLPPARVDEMQETVAEVRALTSGRTLSYMGRTLRLRDPYGPCPLFVAAIGPRMLRAAGAVADGVILLGGLADDMARKSLELMRAGAQEAGRHALGEVWLATYAIVTDDVDTAARQLKPLCLNIALNGGAATLAARGIKVDMPARRPEVYPDLAHAEDWDRAIELSDQYVSDAAVRLFSQDYCLTGTRDGITERLRRLRELGITGVFVQQVGSYEIPAGLMTALAPRELGACSHHRA